MHGPNTPDGLRSHPQHTVAGRHNVHLRLGSVVESVAVTPPADLAEAMRVDAKQAVTDIDALAASGRHVPGMYRMRREICAAVEAGRLAWLRRALSSYIVGKCREMLGA